MPKRGHIGELEAVVLELGLLINQNVDGFVVYFYGSPFRQTIISQQFLNLECFDYP
jgi:hypothetical protein